LELQSSHKHFVIAGLDPAIHAVKSLLKRFDVKRRNGMDAMVKPWHDRL
jgi:hypothetical protein